MKSLVTHHSYLSITHWLSSANATLPAGAQLARMVSIIARIRRTVARAVPVTPAYAEVRMHGWRSSRLEPV